MWQERFEKNSLIRTVGSEWSISNKDNQPLNSRFALMAGLTSSKTTERSVQILRLQFHFSKASLQRSFLNSWLLEGDIEEREGVLLALVFLGIVLGKAQRHQKKKPRANCKLTQKNRTKIYMMHEQFKCHDACSNAVRLLFNLSSNSQNWLEHRVSNKNPKNLKNHLNNL